MGEYKVKKIYGEENFSRLFKNIIEEEIRKISYLIKEDINAQYDKDNYPSTCEKVEEVYNK